jgi:CRISPR system Cascade subunit CasA
MSDFDLNLLSEPLICSAPCGALSLSGVLAALARDEIESFAALRPHQAPAWRMFLGQIGALALHRSETTTLPQDERAWRDLLRALTPQFPDDEPWRLVVDDRSKPGFLQPPVPKDVTLSNRIETPDALDLLITSRNHDLKQAVGRRADPEDWIYALVSLQTGEGFGGATNYGIARMNGGSSSRAMMALAPAPGGKGLTPRPGACFHRDIRALLQSRERELAANDHLGFPAEGGIALVWVAPWPEGEQIPLSELDIWFVEVCRRIRLSENAGTISAAKGTSKATRIDAKAFKGVLGDPYAPVHKTEGKSFTLGEGDFDYRRVTDLLLSGDWRLPVLARPASFDRETLTLVCSALSRGNSKTDGFKTRSLPLSGKVAQAIGPRQAELFELASDQMGSVKAAEKALENALALAAAGGDPKNIKKIKKRTRHASAARTALDRAADTRFFEHLWARFSAQEHGEEALEAERRRFARFLRGESERAFEAALPTMPCAAAFRLRAEARARRAFGGALRHALPEAFSYSVDEDEADAA